MTKVNCNNEDCINNCKGICTKEEVEFFVGQSGDFFCETESCSYKRKEDGSYDITEEHEEVYPNINYDTNGLEDIKKDAIIAVDYETYGLNMKPEEEEAVREAIASSIKKGGTSGTVILNRDVGLALWSIKIMSSNKFKVIKTGEKMLEALKKLEEDEIHE